MASASTTSASSTTHSSSIATSSSTTHSSSIATSTRISKIELKQRPPNYFFVFIILLSYPDLFHATSLKLDIESRLWWFRWLRWLLLLIKTRPGTSRVTNTRSFFYYTVMDGDLYPDVIMMLQAIDLKSEKLNPIHYLHGEQHRSLMSNFTSVMFLRLEHVDYSH